MINKKTISIFLIVLSLGLFFTGCNTVNAFRKIIGEPNVHGVSIKVEKDTVNVEVILEKDSEVNDMDGLIERCKSIAKKQYKDKNINVNIVKARYDTKSY